MGSCCSKCGGIVGDGRPPSLLPSVGTLLTWTALILPCTARAGGRGVSSAHLAHMDRRSHPFAARSGGRAKAKAPQLPLLTWTPLYLAARSGCRGADSCRHGLRPAVSHLPPILCPPSCSQHVLVAEGQTAAAMAYDRPSPKLLAFLKRHYGESTTHVGGVPKTGKCFDMGHSALQNAVQGGRCTTGPQVTDH